MSYLILIDILACWIEQLSLSLSAFFSSLEKRKKRNQPSSFPFFDIPISTDAPTRAIYIYIHIYTQTHTRSR
jgi:hypothetical protein